MKVTRLKKYNNQRRRKTLLRLLKSIFRNVLYFAIGFIYFLYKIYECAEKCVLKVFNKFPLWIKRLIILTILANIIFLNNNPQIKVIEKVVTKTEKVFLVEQVQAIESKEKETEEYNKCSYGKYECIIYNVSLDLGLNEEQAKISIAISKWETGNYTSNLFKNSNNIGGLYNSNTKTFYKFNTIEEGINSFVKNLKNGYFDKGLNSIEEIQKKYCPVGAENDPNGLNKNWISGVTYFYNQL